MKAIGIDIGTTTISGVIVDAESRAVVRAKTIENGSFIKTEHEWERIQDAELIIKKAKELLDELLAGCDDAVSVGLTGQMHGILYVDEKGKCISPLYTWQDGRGNLPEPDGRSLVEEIYEKYQVKTASGYGMVTHFYNLRNYRGYGTEGKKEESAFISGKRNVSGEAASLCTIADYFGMTLTGRRKPLIHTSMADSLGFFDGEKGTFRKDMITAFGRACRQPGVMMAGEKASAKLPEGRFTEILPEVTGELAVLGEYRGIPVTAALGDSQASFLGSVGMEEGAFLVNMGTGGQISAISDSYCKAPGIEARPYLNGKYLLTGASLCGGRAYAILESFFRSYLSTACGEQKEEQYKVMEKLAEKGFAGGNTIKVVTAFRGSRVNPGLRGSISGIDEDNFTPEAMVCGVLEGMARELFELYGQIHAITGLEAKRLVASGNGLRRNRILREIFSQMFEAELTLAPYEEEAAYGAAVGSLLP